MNGEYNLLDTLKSHNALFFGATGFGATYNVNGVPTRLIEDTTARQSYQQEQMLTTPSRQYRRYIVEEAEWLRTQGRLPTKGDNAIINGQYVFLDSVIEEDGLWYLTTAGMRQG